jgi:Glu-tRNA(Gln) amidotransferase subunit E-like FAD-binding protein
VKEWGIPPVAAAVALIQLPKRVARKLRTPAHFSPELFRNLFTAVREKRLTLEGILPLLLRTASGEEVRIEELPGPCPPDEFEELVTDVRSRLPQLPLRSNDRTHVVMMGLLMEKVRGRMPGRDVAERLTARIGRGNG